jgi:hypothetical protein
MGKRQSCFQAAASLYAKSGIARRAKKPPSPVGAWRLTKISWGRSLPLLYCSGGFFSEPGFTDRVHAMTFHRSSEVLMMPPKGGMGPTTTSDLTRL